MASLTPDSNGVSLADLKRLEAIMTILFGEIMAQFMSATTQITDEERNTFKDIVLKSVENYKATCPADAQAKIMEEH